ncbi:MAG TPA: ABC transporter permease [Dehalococcoidia bacterium]
MTLKSQPRRVASPASAEDLGTALRARPGSHGRRVIRRAVARRPGAAVAALLLTVLVMVGVLAPVLPLPDPDRQALTDRLRPPLSRGVDGTLHVAGTDQLGRDVLSRTVAGARISLAVALLTVLVSGMAGTALGLVAGYRGGMLDQAVMRLVDFQMAFPVLVLAIFLLYLLGPGTQNLVLFLSTVFWVNFARMARAQALSVREQPFVEGAVAVGCTPGRILVRHVLPHVLPVLVTVAVLDFAAVILAEAGLSFLGLGVPPPAPSWGRMLAEGQRFVYAGGWWMFLAPGLTMFGTVLAANVLARWLQDMLTGSR